MADTSTTQHDTWLVVGASRGIGLEFCRQLHALGHQVIGTVRDTAAVWKVDESHGRVVKLVCDVSSEDSINVRKLRKLIIAIRFNMGQTTDKFAFQKFIDQLGKLGNPRIDYCVINAGILHYPNVRLLPFYFFRPAFSLPVPHPLAHFLIPLLYFVENFSRLIRASGGPF
jgi:NAD(P)-dependent dehydrogenase (short-subunit alcohol dehydrogenase family)